MRFLKDLLDVVVEFVCDVFAAIFQSAIFYIALPFVLSPIVLYWWFFTPSQGDGNLRAIETPYSISISNYVTLNENGLCNTYKDFVKDYVIYRQSERMKNGFQGSIKYYMSKDLSNKSKALLNSPKYGELFQKAKAEFDKVDVRHTDVGNDYYTKMFIASNVVDQDRFFLDVMTSGSTYGGKYQTEVFSTIEYNRCVDLESEFGLVDKLAYAIEKKLAKVFWTLVS